MASVAAVIEQAPPRASREKAPLRVGIVADSAVQPRWLAAAFADLAGFAKVEIIVDLGRQAARPSLLWRAYCGVDQRVFGNGIDPTVPCNLAQTVPHERDADSIEALAGLGLDVVFTLGDVPAATVAPFARYGAWRFGFGSDGGAPLPAAGLPEADSLVAASGLLATLPGETEERWLCRSWARTFPLSLARSRRGLLPKSSGFARTALKRLHENGDAWIGASERVRAQPRGALANAAGYLRHMAGVAPYVAKRGLQQLTSVDQWFIAYRFGNPNVLTGEAIANLQDFHRIMPPTDRFWADPFPFEHNGRHYIFLEELPFEADHAYISVTEVDRAGKWSTPVPVLKRPYHLSYPLLMQHRGQLYMVPETGKNGTVEVWRCTSFPDQWQLEKVLLEDICSADATFHRSDDGRWWMFVSVFPKESRYVEGGDELHIYYADDFLGPYRPHAMNPVNSDVRSARPAGYMYTRNGVLHRPAQIGVPIYGSGMAINQVLRLTPTEFVEKQVEVIRPKADGVLGIHTLNSCGRLTVIDAFTRTRKR